ncbi:MAG: hypothetical protein Q9220_005394 [cf. Caloplaca sp. 1 TL-2023]
MRLTITRARLPSLFSDFTAQRLTNPDGYHANVRAWEDVLSKAARAGLFKGNDGVARRLSIETGPLLMRRLESAEYGRPLALDAVFSEALSQGRMMSLPSFLSSPHTIYSYKWTNLPWRMFTWGLGQMALQRGFRSEKTQVPREIVLIPNVEKLAETVVEHIEKLRTRVDRTLTKSMFQREVGAALGIDEKVADSDLLIILRYLARDRQVLTYDSNVVKISDSNEVRLPISEEDRSIASLKSLIQDLQDQVHILGLEITNAKKKGERAIESKNRPLALAALRSKRVAEKVLAQRLETLYQLEEVRDRIQQAADQVTIMSVLRDSAKVLRTLNNQVGSVSDVEDSLQTLKEEVGKVEDISLAINQAGHENTLNDNSDIEEELDQLLLQVESTEAKVPVVESSQQSRTDIKGSGNADRSGIERSPSEVKEVLNIPEPASSLSLAKESDALMRMSLDKEENSSPRTHRPEQDRDQIEAIPVQP